MTTHSRAGVGGLYYGWRVVAALFVVGMMVYGAGLYAFTLFIPPFTAEFGWSRTATGAIVSIFWLAAPLTLASGYLNRHFGAFRLLVCGVILEALCMAAVGFAHTLTFMLCVRALMGLAKILMACGVTPLASLWFRRRFGLAAAICYSGWHFGGLVLAPLSQYLIDHIGWRRTSFTLALLIASVGLPLLIKWCRVASPAQLGLVLDGMALGPSASIAVETSSPAPAAAAGSLMTAAFLCPLAVTLLGGFTYGSLLTHEVALITDRHIGHSTASASLSLTAGCALLGALLMGYVSDRLPYKRAMAVELGIMALSVVGFLGFLQAGSDVLLFFSAAAFGLSVGGFDPSLVAHIRRQFDLRTFSTAFGIWYFCYLGTLFVSPIAVGHLYDESGGYRTPLLIMIGCILVAIAIVYATPVGRAEHVD